MNEILAAIGNALKKVDWKKVASAMAVTAAVVGGASALAKNASDHQLIEESVSKEVAKRLPHEVK